MNRADFETAMRWLTAQAWSAGETDLAIELEATAYRCLGLNLDAERRARLARADQLRAAGDPRPWLHSAPAEQRVTYRKVEIPD